MIARLRNNLARLLNPQPKPESIFMNRNERYSAYEIGDWSYGEPNVMKWDETTKLTIGRFCSIAEGVVIMLGGEHRTDWITTYPFNVLFDDAKGYEGHPRSKGDVTIGHD